MKSNLKPLLLPSLHRHALQYVEQRRRRHLGRLGTSHTTHNTQHTTPHTSHLTPHTSHLTPHTSHLTPHTSHLTPHTSHLTPRTSHLTPHTPHLTPHSLPFHQLKDPGKASCSAAHAGHVQGGDGGVRDTTLPSICFCNIWTGTVTSCRIIGRVPALEVLCMLGEGSG